jgi:hypothetical protein
VRRGLVDRQFRKMELAKTHHAGWKGQVVPPALFDTLARLVERTVQASFEIDEKRLRG